LVTLFYKEQKDESLLVALFAMSKSLLVPFLQKAKHFFCSFCKRAKRDSLLVALFWWAKKSSVRKSECPSSEKGEWFFEQHMENFLYTLPLKEISDITVCHRITQTVQYLLRSQFSGIFCIKLYSVDFQDSGKMKTPVCCFNHRSQSNVQRTAFGQILNIIYNLKDL